ncbi:MAG: cytochrome c-type biogenesis protein [Beijerinckiaceae bacterium]
MVSLALCLAPVAVVAVQPDEILKDPALEARARHLSGELRCLVCQNQSIDDSDAPLARDLRILVRERLTAGDSDAQVKSFLVARYGEFVLLRTAVSARTILLWSAPFLVLGVGALVAYAAARRRNPSAGASMPLTEHEKERLAKITGE